MCLILLHIRWTAGFGLIHLDLLDNLIPIKQGALLGNGSHIVVDLTAWS